MVLIPPQKTYTLFGGVQIANWHYLDVKGLQGYLKKQETIKKTIGKKMEKHNRGTNGKQKQKNIKIGEKNRKKNEKTYQKSVGVLYYGVVY